MFPKIYKCSILNSSANSMKVNFSKTEKYRCSECGYFFYIEFSVMSFRLWGVYGGSTGIMSSSVDMTKWMLMQLNNGKDQNGNVVIRESDLSHTHSPQTAIRSSTVEKYFHRPLTPFTVTEVTYAMGWKNGFYKGRQNSIILISLTLVLLNPDIPCLCKQCRSRSVGF